MSDLEKQVYAWVAEGVAERARLEVQKAEAMRELANVDRLIEIVKKALPPEAEQAPSEERKP